jgi:hypothetical protein
VADRTHTINVKDKDLKNKKVSQLINCETFFMVGLGSRRKERRDLLVYQGEEYPPGLADR